MTIYPEFMDTLSAANLKKGQIPFYIMRQEKLTNITLHHHDFAEFSFVTEGSGTETINGQTFGIKPGTVRFLLPHQMHAITSSSESPMRLYCCMFDFSILLETKTDNTLCKLLLQSGDRFPSCNVLTGRAKAAVQRLCEELLEEYEGGEIGKNSSIRAKLIEALLLYVRSFSDINLSELTYQADEPHQLDWEIIGYLNTHYVNSIKLKDLSDRFGLSVSYISAIFQKNLGRSFLTHLHMLRVRRACGLLLSTDFSIYQIAEEAGFESFRTFSRLFKETMNMTPGQYRQSYGAAGHK